MQLSAEMLQEIIKTLRSDERSSSRHGMRKEGRVGVRCAVDLVPHTFDDNGAKIIKVKVRDVAPSGIGFISRTSMTVGQELICRLPTEGGAITEVPMTVRHCHRISKDLFNVGAKFNGPLGQAGAAEAARRAEALAAAAGSK